MCRFGKAHGDARTNGGGQADEEGLPGVLRGKGGGENGGECRDRTVHQARQTWLDVGQQELPFRSFFLFGLCIVG